MTLPRADGPSVELAALADHDHLRTSYGLVKSADSSGVGTLWDPRIFGSTRLGRCECGRTRAPKAESNLCPWCGVLASRSRMPRRTRFGHIALQTPIPHPLAQNAQIGVIAVLPIWYRSALPAARDLNWCYQRVLEANTQSDANVLASAVGDLFGGEQRNIPHTPRRPLSLRSLFNPISGCTIRDVGSILKALSLQVVARDHDESPPNR